MTLVGLAGLAAGIPIGVGLHKVYARPSFDDPPFIDRLRQEYDLTNEQVTLVRAILKSRDSELLDVYRQDSRSLSVPQTLRIEAINRTADERIEVILDAGQQQRYRRRREPADIRK